MRIVLVIKNFLGFSILFFGMLVATLSTAETIEQSLVRAIEHSPQIREQYARFQTVLQQREIVRSEYYPQVSIRGAVGPEQTNYLADVEVDEELTREDISLRISQSLFSGFDTSANSDRLFSESESERLQLHASAENLALQVSEVYLNVLRGKQLVDLTQAHVKTHEETLASVKGLMEKGFANQADIAQVSARLANAWSSLIAAQNNYHDSHAQFYRVIGQSPSSLIMPAVDKSLLPLSLSDAMAWAKETHPQLKSAMADIDAARHAVKASKAGYYPRLSIEGVANHNNDIGSIEGRDEDYRVQLVLEYDLYNGGRDSSRARASNWQYNEALEIRRNAEQDLMEGTRFSWNAYTSVSQQLSYIGQSVDAATLAEDGYVTQYKLGKRSLLDLLNASAEVFIARRNYINAEVDLTQAQYRLLNSTGRLAYAMRVSFPEQWKGEK
jgi:adhesin transport system outer membrane protein